MSQPIDLTKRKFGRLTPLRIVGRNPVIWECKCDCGGTCQKAAGSLTTGNCKSCGCLRKETCGNRARKRPFEWLYTTVKNRKKYVDLSYEEFVEFTKVKECHYCGEELHWIERSTKHGTQAYNLDCKDNSLGYTKTNLVACCSRCNAGKSDKFTYAEWIAIGKCIRTMREKAVGVGA